MRSFSLVLLRRLLFRALPSSPSTLRSSRITLYDHLSEPTRTSLERALLSALANEPSQSVRPKLADTITDLATASFDRGRPWLALQAQSFSATLHTDHRQRESAYRIFGNVPALMGDQQVDAIVRVLQRGLQDPESLEVGSHDIMYLLSVHPIFRFGKLPCVHQQHTCTRHPRRLKHRPSHFFSTCSIRFLPSGPLVLPNSSRHLQRPSHPLLLQLIYFLHISMHFLPTCHPLSSRSSMTQVLLPQPPVPSHQTLLPRHPAPEPKRPMELGHPHRLKGVPLIPRLPFHLCKSPHRRLLNLERITSMSKRHVEPLLNSLSHLQKPDPEW